MSDSREKTIPVDVAQALDCPYSDIIGLVEKLIYFAYVRNASDIHFDPWPSLISVRMRIDGMLTHMFTIPTLFHAEIIARIKVCATLRTDEHQKPQDGHFNIRFAEQPVDIRVAIAPTYYGENAVLRLLVNKSKDLLLEDLGFSATDRTKILRSIGKTSGMILATGPTGSGKTTTLYALVTLLNTENVSIVTIEDPIEYSIDGVRQIQANPQAQLTFASGLRSILRQDPDIIMVGEIRDHETANLAVQTALTGHLLLSTLHTSNAGTTLPRLLDMGIEPYLVASTVSVAIGQRLARKICTMCKKVQNPTSGEMAQVRGFKKMFTKTSDYEQAVFYRGSGCTACHQTGYSGRISVNEVLVVDDSIREAIVRKESADTVSHIAIESGMTTMAQDGLSKVLAGKTTFEEMLRILYE